MMDSFEKAMATVLGIVILGLGLLLGLAIHEAMDDTPYAPRMVSTAPDGTTVWRTKDHGTVVYFSTRGAQYTQGCGKNCTETVMVPNRGGS